jgi:hypothetical protein
LFRVFWRRPHGPVNANDRPSTICRSLALAYFFTHEDKAERERLAPIEAGLDPFTIECLEKVNLADEDQNIAVRPSNAILDRLDR